jgi:hypothetical protein
MSIFGMIDLESVVQVGEKTRLDVSRSFLTQDEEDATLVEIKPSDSDSYITVSGVSVTQDQWYLDWIYAAAGSQTVSLRITTDGAPSVFTSTITVVTVASDALFASDDDLAKFEPDIKKWLPSGKSTWNFVHRKVQDKILTELYKSRIFDANGDKLEKAAVVDTAEVREWACYMALSIIFTGISNAPDDVFHQKSLEYAKKEHTFMNYSLNILKLDYDGDGTLESSERVGFRSTLLVRR